MKVHEAGDLAKNWECFWLAVIRVICKETAQKGQRREDLEDMTK